jgi:hypothetical protein
MDESTLVEFNLQPARLPHEGAFQKDSSPLSKPCHACLYYSAWILQCTVKTGPIYSEVQRAPARNKSAIFPQHIAFSSYHELNCVKMWHIPLLPDLSRVLA